MRYINFLNNIVINEDRIAFLWKKWIKFFDFVIRRKRIFTKINNLKSMKFRLWNRFFPLQTSFQVTDNIKVPLLITLFDMFRMIQVLYFKLNLRVKRFTRKFNLVKLSMYKRLTKNLKFSKKNFKLNWNFYKFSKKSNFKMSFDYSGIFLYLSLFLFQKISKRIKRKFYFK